mgnify:CR=1 FL=1
MEPLVEVEELKKFYPIKGGIFSRKVEDVKAVDGANLSISRGECFGLVGESGCGKTTLGKTILRLLEPTSGHIYFGVPIEVMEKIKQLRSEDAKSGKLRELMAQYDLATFKGKKLKQMRRRMQIVYQDPSMSLNPRMLVKDIVGEPLKVQGLAKGPEIQEKVLKTFNEVGLTGRHLRRYPHEFSGGQKQRIAIARALVTHPEFVVLDEPTSSVDVSVRAQLLSLFQNLQRAFNLTYLFISHDLSVVECISDIVAVMYLGKIVEIAPTEDLFYKPLHPYSKALFSAIPVPDPTKRRRRAILRGEVPSPVNPPSGCRFHPRCAIAEDICREKEPELINVGGGHLVACHLIKG